MRDDDPLPRRISTEELRARKPARADFAALPRTPIALVLDRVHGPYNQGALFRLADGFLLEHLHFCRAALVHWNRRFKKAGRGTPDWVPHTVGEDTVEVVRAYRERGYRIVVAEQARGSVPLGEASLRGPMCLVLGAELHGVCEEALALADVVVEFPNLGMANSFNISMSAAMLVSGAFAGIRAAERDRVAILHATESNGRGG